MAIQLLFCGALLPEFVQYNSYHSCTVSVYHLSMCFVSIYVVHLYSSIDTTTAWKKSCFILLDRSDFHMTDSLSIVIQSFTKHILTSLSVDEMLRYMNLSYNFRGLPFRVKMAPFQLKHIYSILFAFTWRLMPPSACSRLCNWDLAWVDIFVRSSMSSV